MDPAETSVVLGYLAGWLNSFHIYAFTLVSGYIFYHLKYEKGRYARFLPFVVNKAKRLLIPYAFASVFWVIPIHSLFFGFDVGNVLWNYLLAVNPSQLWFLIMLFLVFVICWCLSDFFKKYDWLSFGVVLVAYSIGLVGSAVAPNIFRIWTALCYVPFFWIGFKLRQHGCVWIRKIPSWMWIVASILTHTLAQYLEHFEAIIFKLMTRGFLFASCVIGALMAFFVLQKLASLFRGDSRGFAFLSRRSMAVYLFHQQIVYGGIYLLNGVVCLYLNATVNFVAATVISLLIATILLRFRITRFLIGEK